MLCITTTQSCNRMDEFVLLYLLLLGCAALRPRRPNNSNLVPNTIQTTARGVNCGLLFQMAGVNP